MISNAEDVSLSSLDFVYLNFRNPGDIHATLAELHKWWARLKWGGVLAGADYCDGELPEGDFWVRSAVAAFFGVNQNLGGADGASNWGGGESGGARGSSQTSACAPGKNTVHRTFERERFASFFVLKTEDRSEAKNSSGVLVKTALDFYPRESVYFSLFFRQATSYGGVFQPHCRKFCGFECARRRRQRRSSFSDGHGDDGPSSSDRDGPSSSSADGRGGRGGSRDVRLRSSPSTTRTACLGECERSCRERERLFQALEFQAGSEGMGVATHPHSSFAKGFEWNGGPKFDEQAVLRVAALPAKLTNLNPK